MKKLNKKTVLLAAAAAIPLAVGAAFLPRLVRAVRWRKYTRSASL